MIRIDRFLSTLLMSLSVAGCAAGQTQSCPPRPNPGTVVTNPPELTSQNGVLNAAFTFRSSFDTAGYLHECYIYQTGNGPVEAPTLRLNPGDRLLLSLTNRLTYLPPPPPLPKAPKSMAAMPGMTSRIEYRYRYRYRYINRIDIYIDIYNIYI